ncbi:TldD/PmbA family protein [Portibacter lacus]|uniref:Zinc metalloprotease n=1 Tax=Portibacter lacus TaxID=1099794 RepID=A0AA37WG17_9BACT|nr:TldD/PmbA family protein [Portibacter lacus]GLR17520.1 zinc metalloprotease [Portibacter lacus]
MKRRNFIHTAALGAGLLAAPIPIFGKNIFVEELLNPGMDVATKKALADVALNTARGLGATYADARIGRYLNQYVFTREKMVQNTVNTESFGIGIRVIANGTWGFASTNDVTPDGIKKATELAISVAKANSKIQTDDVVLAPVQGYGDVSWKTPIEKSSMSVPVSEKVDLLLEANARALENGADYISSALFSVNEQKYFASTEGSYIDQDVHRIWPTLNVTAIDKASGKFKNRQGLAAPMGMGYEYLIPDKSEEIMGAGGVVLYRNRYDIVADAIASAKQAKEMLTAKSVEAGKYDLVLEPNHLGLTIHESVGHPLELDRVLGYEANYAGTSFATLDKLEAGDFNYGNELVNLVADKTQPHSLGAVGYDDEGVKCKKWDLVRNGTLVNYQAIRDQVHMIGQNESHGCCYSQSWNDVQFQRMPNVSLEPGKEKYSINDMIKDVEKGIYLVGRGSYSIDQQRYNFQFGGTLTYEIKNGEITGMVNDAAYQSNTQEFWNSCAKICDKDDYRIFGSFFDGKGQPSQVSAVSHGCSTTRFNGVNVINTGRNI